MLERDVMPIEMGAKGVNLTPYEAEAPIQTPRRILVFDDLEVDRSHLPLSRPIEGG